MENASKALLIAGAILLCILIIAIGMFIYNGAQSTITGAMTSFSTQEVEAFNNQFLPYEGKIKGTKLKSLFSKLITNASVYHDEPDKLPCLTFDKLHVNGTQGFLIPDASGEQKIYIKCLGLYRNDIELNHEYTVSIEFQPNGLIDYFWIVYGDQLREFIVWPDREFIS